MPDIDIEKLGLYLVEGFVEVDPLSDKVTIRAEDKDGNTISFDPIPVLEKLKGQEVRIVIVPLVSVQQLEALVKNQEASGGPVLVVDPPTFDTNQSN
jgi:hypothetical protein